jgi:carbon storage regulator
MLVLSRKPGERIVIGRSMVLTVVEISGNRVRLAFEGPREITVHREEILKRYAATETPLEEPAAAASRYFAECP